MHCIVGVIINCDILFIWFGNYLYLVTFNKILTNFKAMLMSHSGFRDPGVGIITKCARTKSHTYDDSRYRNECHIFTI